MPPPLSQNITLHKNNVQNNNYLYNYSGYYYNNSISYSYWLFIQNERRKIKETEEYNPSRFDKTLDIIYDTLLARQNYLRRLYYH